MKELTKNVTKLTSKALSYYNKSVISTKNDSISPEVVIRNKYEQISIKKYDKGNGEYLLKLYCVTNTDNLNLTYVIKLRYTIRLFGLLTFMSCEINYTGYTFSMYLEKDAGNEFTIRIEPIKLYPIDSYNDFIYAIEYDIGKKIDLFDNKYVDDNYKYRIKSYIDVLKDMTGIKLNEEKGTEIEKMMQAIDKLGSVINRYSMFLDDYYNLSDEKIDTKTIYPKEDDAAVFFITNKTTNKEANNITYTVNANIHVDGEILGIKMIIMYFDYETSVFFSVVKIEYQDLPQPIIIHCREVGKNNKVYSYDMPISEDKEIVEQFERFTESNVNILIQLISESIEPLKESIKELEITREKKIDDFLDKYIRKEK